MSEPLRLSRRRVVSLAGAALALPWLPRGLRAAPAGRHGLSIFGALKYGPDFPHFDYVNPAAPKGGTFSQIGPTTAFNASFYTFDTLNGYILRGNAAQGLSLIFDTLMVRAFDEPDALYGLVAESVEISEDGNRYIFRLREGAQFHDGSPLTAEDAAFSFLLLKEKGHPLISQNMSEVAAAERWTHGHSKSRLPAIKRAICRFLLPVDCRSFQRPIIPRTTSPKRRLRRRLAAGLTASAISAPRVSSTMSASMRIGAVTCR